MVSDFFKQKGREENLEFQVNYPRAQVDLHCLKCALRLVVWMHRNNWMGQPELLLLMQVLQLEPNTPQQFTT